MTLPNRCSKRKSQKTAPTYDEYQPKWEMPAKFISGPSVTISAHAQIRLDNETGSEEITPANSSTAWTTICLSDPG